MSEQTPDTNNNLSDGQDPSMEDILASIRKIIADDDGQDGTADMADNIPEFEVSGIEAQDAVGGDLTDLAHTDLDTTDLAKTDTLDLDIITDDRAALDMDIDALIGDMDVESTGALEIPQIETPSISDDVMDDVLDLEIPMDESETQALAMDDTFDLVKDEIESSDAGGAFEDELDDLIANIDDEIISRPEPPKAARGLMGGAMVALGLGGAGVEADEPLEDDLSLMLDNMLEDSASYQEEAAIAEASIADVPIAAEKVIDPAEDLLSELDMSDEDTGDGALSKTDPDMDLVKSLMADLTEEPLHDDDAAEPSGALSVDIDDEPHTDDVMDEILSMTLDDETKLSEEIAIPTIPEPEVEHAPLSLKEIAAEADADAQTSDSMLGKGLAAAAGLGVVGAASMDAAVSSQEDNIISEELESDDVDAALSQLDELLAEEPEDLDIPTTPEPNIIEPHLEETPTMARANKSDAIIDEVTETATAGAFASLNSVVEEKATVAERGDRIGDLVMEALQPMLKEWLDANLKGIVERAVTKEVKRISSGK